MIEHDTAHAPRSGSWRGIVAVLKHRWATLVGIAIGVFGVWEGSDVSTRFAVVTVIMAAAYLPIGALRRQFRTLSIVLVEVGGVLVFAALALGALVVDGPAAYYLLATAWFGHGVWDFLHHRSATVVPPWYAELCGTIDLCIAAGLLAAAR